MTDKKFVELLMQVRIEIHKRIGRKMCKELYWDCFDCQSRIMIGVINSWIDVLEWKSERIKKGLKVK